MKNQLIKASAVIAAAGKGSRMNSSVNKQYLMLWDKSVLAHTLAAFEQCSSITEIIVVIHADDDTLFHECIQIGQYTKITAVIHGGKERQASVYEGILKISKDSDIVVVHDGARPLIGTDVIENSIAVALEKGAACVGVPVKDTIKLVDGSQVVEETLDRSKLWAIQTPQTFRKEILLHAHNQAIAENFVGTDDSVLVERLGQRVHMVMGSYTNIKITTPEDLIFANAIIEKHQKKLRE